MAWLTNPASLTLWRTQPSTLASSKTRQAIFWLGVPLSHSLFKYKTSFLAALAALYLTLVTQWVGD